MKRFSDRLKEKGVVMRPASVPNPIVRSEEGVWVIVEARDRSERCRFLVDEDVYAALVAPHRWNVGGVERNRVYHSGRTPSGNSTVLLARFIFDPPADREVDHINGDPLDNRYENLRVATRKQNEENRHVSRGKSKYRGVHPCKQTGRWRAQVTHNYTAHKSPRFDTEEEARAWAVAKRDELFTHHRQSS